MTTMKKIDELMEECDGVAGTSDVADRFGVADRDVQAWAARNNVPRIGNGFAFASSHVEAFVEDLDELDDPEGGDETDEELEVKGEMIDETEDEDEEEEEEEEDDDGDDDDDES